LENRKHARLILVSVNNNNKFYNMDQDETGDTFTCEYGRVDVTKALAHYPMSQWDKKFKEKIKKGYVDRTDMLLVKEQRIVTYTPIASKDVQSFIDKLLTYANKTVEENYKISGAQVTEAQLKGAQASINNLVKLERDATTKIANVNDALLELYTIIPRRMGNVKNYLITKKDQIPRYISDEQTLLDTIEGEYRLYQKKVEDQKKLEAIAKEPKKSFTILEAHDLDVTLVEDGKVIDKIRKLMGPNANQFVAAYAVDNLKTSAAYNKMQQEFALANPNIQLLWHGSRNENWWSIATRGLLIRPSNAIHNGSMFGDGVYFADKAQKSIGYTSYLGSYWARGKSAHGYLALYDVYLGNWKEAKNHTSSMRSLNYETLIKEGYHSFFAKGGADLRNNEYIVYRADQTNIRYIIEFK
jgi:poly [ADP-ribose] polymerase